jgi:hypothetical protein
MTFELCTPYGSSVSQFQHRNQVVWSILEAFEQVAPNIFCQNCQGLEDEKGKAYYFWDVFNGEDTLRQKFFGFLGKERILELYWSSRRKQPPERKFCKQKFSSHSEWVVLPCEIAVLTQVAESNFDDILRILGLDYRNALRDFCNFLIALRNEQNYFVVT